MTRHESRQEAFCLLFERIFTDATLEEVMENAVEGRDASLSAYAVAHKSAEKENYCWNYRKCDCFKKIVFSKTDYPN